MREREKAKERKRKSRKKAEEKKKGFKTATGNSPMLAEEILMLKKFCEKLFLKLNFVSDLRYAVRMVGATPAKTHD